MDAGTFIASGRSLKAWLVVPPLLIVGIGLGSYALQRRAVSNLRQTQALSDVLPGFIQASRNAEELIGGFRAGTGEGFGSEDQLISFLQEAANRNGFEVESSNVVPQDKRQTQQPPARRAVVEGSGSFEAIQLYMNDVLSSQKLLSIDSVKISQQAIPTDKARFDAQIVFKLLLIDGMLKSGGGMP